MHAHCKCSYCTFVFDEWIKNQLIHNYLYIIIIVASHMYKIVLMIIVLSQIWASTCTCTYMYILPVERVFFIPNNALIFQSIFRVVYMYIQVQHTILTLLICNSECLLLSTDPDAIGLPSFSTTSRGTDASLSDNTSTITGTIHCSGDMTLLDRI